MFSNINGGLPAADRPADRNPPAMLAALVTVMCGAVVGAVLVTRWLISRGQTWRGARLVRDGGNVLSTERPAATEAVSGGHDPQLVEALTAIGKRNPESAAAR